MKTSSYTAYLDHSLQVSCDILANNILHYIYILYLTTIIINCRAVIRVYLL